MSLVSLSTGSEEIISMRGGSDSGVPVGTPWPSVMKPFSHTMAPLLLGAA